MALIVIAGCSNCPYYARIEMLADQLSANLPDFHVRKIVKLQHEWENFIEELIRGDGDAAEWNLRKPVRSPLVWRELLQFGGRRLLIGGAAEFQEYINGYYKLTSQMSSCYMINIARENIKIKQQAEEDELVHRANEPPVLNVSITGANSPVCYNMLSFLSNGDIFGPDVIMNVHFYDSEYCEAAEAIAMELTDTASHHVKSVTTTNCVELAFNKADVIILHDNDVQEAEESDEDWAVRQWRKYVEYGEMIDQTANTGVRVLVAVTKAGQFGWGRDVSKALLRGCNSRPDLRQNMLCVTRLMDMHACSLLATHFRVHITDISDVIIIGDLHPQQEQIVVNTDQTRLSSGDVSAIIGPLNHSRFIKDLGTAGALNIQKELKDREAAIKKALDVW